MFLQSPLCIHQKKEHICLVIKQKYTIRAVHGDQFRVEFGIKIKPTELSYILSKDISNKATTYEIPEEATTIDDELNWGLNEAS